MIINISFSNFYSIRKTAELSFEVKSKTGKNDSFITTPSKKRLTKLMAVIGPNASGKTNLLKGVIFLTYFICESFYAKSEDIPYKEFAFSKNQKKHENSEFNFEFEVNNKVYSYCLVLNSGMVLKESLKVMGRRKNITLFLRVWEKTKEKYTYKLNGFSLSDDIKPFVRQNVSLLSTTRKSNEISGEICDYLDKYYSNVQEVGRASSEAFLNDTFRYLDINKKMLTQIEYLLKKFDVGLSKINLNKQEINGSLVYSPVSTHMVGTKTYYLPFIYESRGTKNLLVLLRIILESLWKGGVAVVDEIDSDLHPYMISEIIKLFTSKVTNPKNAQLFFCTHSPHVLNELDRTQVYIVDKTKDGGTLARRLSSIKGVREADNYYAKYMAGVYEGVPVIK